MTGNPPPLQIRPRTSVWWRAHQASVRHWIHLAFRDAAPGYVLKTDLFDEASGPYHLAADLPSHLRFLGLDLDASIAACAFTRIRLETPSLGCVVADVRHLPLRRESAAAVLSLSTLDHLQSREEIRHALAEILALLRPGGILLLTLDNPTNPEVALRMRLPASVVHRLRADSFPLGRTLSRREGTRLLESLGFRVRETFYLGHALRYPTLRLLAPLERKADPRPARLVERLTLALEGLSTTPLASVTGHYVGWIAVKPGAPGWASQEVSFT